MKPNPFTLAVALVVLGSLLSFPARGEPEPRPSVVCAAESKRYEAARQAYRDATTRQPTEGDRDVEAGVAAYDVAQKARDARDAAKKALDECRARNQ